MAENTTGSPRSGIILIAGVAFTVVQSAVKSSPAFSAATSARVPWLERRQYDNAGVGKLRPDCDHDVDATETRQTKVHEGNVWRQLSIYFSGFRAI